MSTTCSHCGEALMGAVNRCWRCGTTFAEPVTMEAPPIRRTAILREYLDPQFMGPPPASEDEIFDAELGEASWGSPGTAKAPLFAGWRGVEEWARECLFDGALLLLAMAAILTTFFSPWGIPLTFATLIFNAARIHRAQTRLGWAAFLGSLLALVLCIARAALLLYQWVYPTVTPPWLPLW
ncbi:MAG: hypothetical protein WD045_04635 [Pirellulaceae bacterium]